MKRVSTYNIEYSISSRFIAKIINPYDISSVMGDI